jgi:hypothetical protein
MAQRVSTGKDLLFPEPQYKMGWVVDQHPDHITARKDPEPIV